ncbi:hypothetical protein IV498_03245 [Paenarthrobacter sp. Z7-10]|uniref:hypothetical protein n=1 Tax=Paenarthrobacter sp. Z7-10 TaxID=2787635 RepID=UPI0022A9DF30|nr:hypothetical protein [Paenarthrobacter sp. Z7-10]MCZ2402219.1 hypothetical protein [Paenarthrobacter sp. Z7-10]
MTTPQDNFPYQSSSAVPSYSGQGSSLGPGQPQYVALPAPRQVVVAFWLYIAAAALSVVSLIIGLGAIGGSKPALRQQLSNQGQQVSEDTLNAFIAAGIAVSIIFAVVWVVLFVLFAFFMKKGANWARIVLTIITVLSLLNIASGYGVGAVQVIAAVIATVLIWLRPAGSYFSAVKARKAALRLS